jgi:hypothetical protein
MPYSDADLIALAGQRELCRYSDNGPVVERDGGRTPPEAVIPEEQIERLLKSRQLAEEPRTGLATFYIPAS